MKLKAWCTISGLAGLLALCTGTQTDDSHCDMPPWLRIHYPYHNQKECESGGCCWSDNELPGGECYLKDSDSCFIPREKRLSLPYKSRTLCEHKAGCYDDDEKDPGKRCYVKKTDKCFQPKEEREGIASKSLASCQRVGGCWDEDETNPAKKCYYRDPICKRLPRNCEVSSRAECTYRPGQTCGLGTMTEERKCYEPYDFAKRGAAESITIQRLCCREKCPPGNGIPPLITCLHVFPWCDRIDLPPENSKGSKSSKGSQPPSAPKSSKGSKGSEGTKGSQPPSSKGSKGSEGTTQPPSTKGSKGSKGTKGTQPPSSKGAKGSKGSKGTTQQSGTPASEQVAHYIQRKGRSVEEFHEQKDAMAT